MFTLIFGFIYMSYCYKFPDMLHFIQKSTKSYRTAKNLNSIKTYLNFEDNVINITKVFKIMNTSSEIKHICKETNLNESLYYLQIYQNDLNLMLYQYVIIMYDKFPLMKIKNVNIEHGNQIDIDIKKIYSHINEELKEFDIWADARTGVIIGFILFILFILISIGIFILIVKHI